MCDTSEEPPGIVERESSEAMSHAMETCEQNKNQLEIMKEIMMRNKQSLKKKEEEVQEYARKISKIKSRAKLSRRSKDDSSSSKDFMESPRADITLSDTLEESIDDISQAKTPKAKSSLLQRKLAENRKAFEERNKEITKSKRAVEEKVEAIRQQLEEKDLSVTPIKPVMIVSDVMSPIQVGNIQEKEKKIVELNNKILELEATILDLQENLKEKDSVIESKTKAVTLMSADLSKKGKTTLDTLEDTKDEMRTMQENFVLLETSLKNKNENLLDQLHERDNRISELEESIKRYDEQIKEQKLAETASVDFSRSTMDTLAETKDAMKSMQENFVLIESSLKLKNDNLLQQLQDYETKLAEANERIFQVESGAGIVRTPGIEDLQYKVEKLEYNNRQLQDEKYELQKSIAEMQDKIIANKSMHGNGALMEKDNRIAELESLIDELKRSNELLKEESKTELQKQLTESSLKNEEYFNRIIDLEKTVHDLEMEKSNSASRLPDETVVTEESEKVLKLTKELDELNKTMIKMKAQHRSKMKNLQKQLENFKMVSDTNAELVKLGNQVALLEEEKGNLQLSLVDFDELKASAGDWQERIADLENKVSTQTKEIQMHIDAIATLEDQKLDLMQELHTVKQEVSALEAENAESENLRVTAEMKVVDLEEQLESLHKAQTETKLESLAPTNHEELLKRIEALTQENTELYNKLSKIEEKGTSDSGSTESFEAIQETDRNDLLKKIEDLSQRNNELTLKLTKLEEKGGSNAGSTESFETINDTDKNELLKKIDQLTQENNDLIMKLNRVEEKGSSDTGSTESFERIPEHNESMTKIELLTQENNELVIKLTKLEEQMVALKSKFESSKLEESKDSIQEGLQMDALVQENTQLSLELSNLRSQMTEETTDLQKRIETLIADNNELIEKQTKLEEHIALLETDISHRSKRVVNIEEEIQVLTEEKNVLEKELTSLRETLSDVQIKNSRTEELLKENVEVVIRATKLEELNKDLKEDLNKVIREKDEIQEKLEQMMTDGFARERLELIDKLEKLNQEKESVSQERQELQEQISSLLHKSTEGSPEIRRKAEEEIIQESESTVVASLEEDIVKYKNLIAEQESFIEGMKLKLSSKEEELERKNKELTEFETRTARIEELEQELKETLNTMEEWRFKCNDMQKNMDIIEEEKTSIEERFNMLQDENNHLLEISSQKEAEVSAMKQQLESTVSALESKLEAEVASASAKEREIISLKEMIESKDQELHNKYTQLQNEMIAIDSLQDELNNSKIHLGQRDALITSLSAEIEILSNTIRTKDEENYSLQKENVDLQEKLQESKSSKEYDELLKMLRDKDMILNDVQNKIEEITRERDDLLAKIENMSQRDRDVQSQLNLKEEEITELKITVERLNVQIGDIEKAKIQAEKRVWELQGMLDNNEKYNDELQIELRNTYKMIEQLKGKHMEDTDMQNRRLQDTIEELNAKLHENDILKTELEEKERLVGQNVTMEVKNSLEAKVADLEQKLADSENKIHGQLEKMKKIAATLKKKTSICQELENRVAELEEKWTTEKDEKESKNKKIQEVESLIREKDNKIADLEEKLAEARKVTAETSTHVEKLTLELNTAKQKMSSLMEQITEMGEEIERLRTEIEQNSADLAAEKSAKENALSDYESYKLAVIKKNEEQQVVLDEAKENARELSVRMQVMETEYVEQLGQIKHLKTENGLLSSKQTQINEKLENVEKESEERQALIERLQNEIGRIKETKTSFAETQTSEDEYSREQDTRISDTTQHSDHCEQCQTLVQALEAKLQEREAEIENLNNELANSISNFLQMRESLRYNDLINQSTVRDRSLEDPYNDLLLQYNALTTNNEGIKAKLGDTLKENNELSEKIKSLQSLNETLKETIASVEQELTENKGATEKLQNVDSLYAELLKKSEEQQKELKEMEQSILSAREHADESERRLNSHIAQFESETRDLNERYMSLVDLKVSLENEVEALKVERHENRRKMTDLQNELEIQRQKNMENKTEASVTGEIFATDAPTVQKDKKENDGSPKLFDASKIFGVSSVSDFTDTHRETNRLQSLLNEKEIHCSRLAHDLDELNREITEERSQMMQNYNCCVKELKIAEEKLHKAEAEIEGLQRVLSERDKYIDTLNVELNSVGSRLKDQADRYNETNTKLQELTAIRNEEMEMLKTELNSAKEDVQSLKMERDQQARLIESYKLQIINLEGEVHNSVDSDLVQDLERRISTAVTEKELLQLQVNDLTRYSEELKELVGSQRNYQVEIQNVLRERDAAREMIVNLTRALEEAQKTAATVETTIQPTTVQLTETAKTEEKNQQSRLDVEPSWDIGSNEKLNVDEETWGWNEEAAQLAGDHHLTAANIIPSEEVRLRAKADELQDKIKDLEADKSRMAEENKNAQVRSGKLVKKLKEYKIQLDSLQQQLKIQKSAGGFCELDSAIEEELKSQIAVLEKSLKQLRDGHKELSGEKEALLKRLDVLVSANERYMEMKERQDMDIEVLRIQNKELSNKVQTLQWRLQDNVTNIDEAATAQASDQNDSSRQEMEQTILHGQPRKRSIEETDDFKSLCKKYKEEIDDLKEGMEALATENEQLQFFLEELKRKAQNVEPKESAEIKEYVQSLDEANKRNLELQGMLNKSREEYDSLRKQYEQSLMDANDQVSVMRQNSDLLKAEVTEKTAKLEGEISDLHRQVEASNIKSNELEIKLQIVLDEKSSLEEKLKAFTSTEEKLSSVNITLSEVTDLLNSRVQEVADLKQELQRQYVDRQEAEDKLQTTIQQLTAEINERRQELDGLRQAFNSKENELMQQKSLDTVSSIVSQATQELVQKHAIEIENKDKEIRELTDKLAMLQSAMNEYFLELLTKTGNIEHQQEEISNLQKNLTEKDSALESVKSELTSAKEDLTRNQTELTRREAELQELSTKVQTYSVEIDNLQKKLNESESVSTNLHQHTITIVDLEKQIETLKAVISEKDLIIQRFEEELAEYKTLLENSRIEFDRLRAEREQIDVIIRDLQNKTEQMSYLESELASERNALEETKKVLSEREALLEITSQKLDDSQAQLKTLSSFSHSDQQQSRNTPGIVDGVPLFRMGGSDDQDLQNIIDQLKHEMEVKEQEIDQLKYVLNENTYPTIIQQMQDSINCLYDEKNHLEASLRTATQTVAEKEKQLESLKQRIEVQQKEIKEDASRDRRSIQDQEEILRLQNELHAKEQEINDLKYIIAEKDSQLSLQASMEPQSDDFELRQTVERLTNELYIKEQELQHLRLKIEELQSEVLRLENIERLSEESKEAIHRLTSEKEHIRQEAEEFLERKLREKEFEIDEIKQRLSLENEKLLNDLQLKNQNLEYLNKQLEESTVTWTQRLREKEEELLHANTDLAEKERRLAELSITKDAELHNLRVQIHEKEVRIEELLALSEEEEKQLVELRESLTARETEINTLKGLLEDKVKEYEMIQNALRKDIPVIDMSEQSSEPTSSAEVQERNSNELDIALYMLHQRDVRCEELTHELMQLLEERDTLQLRLSNAIRVNEELRKMASADFSPKKDLTSSPGENEPLVEHPSPSKSEGPVEIAKEAIDSPIGEDKEALALKLSQLHNVDHARDVRLRDDRELRHTQQMSLLAHKDVLSTLPPEAAAKLVNANYTLSRDVQSQSSVLLNWLWGKSTPKVVHM